MDSFLHDLRYTVRILAKKPGFTLVVLATLAIGIGANTAIFTVVDAALLRSLPYREPERLVHLWETRQQQDFEDRGASIPDFLDWQKASETFDSMAGYTSGLFTVGGTDTPERIAGVSVTPGLFDLLGVRPALGRTFSADEDRPGDNHVVILSHGVWQRRFGSDVNIPGRQLTLNGQPYTIVGVLPADFHFAKVGDAEIWIPLDIPSQRAGLRFFHWLNVIARLKPGVSIEAAKAQMQSIAGGIAEADPKHSGTSIKVVPLQDEIVGSIKPILFALLGAVGLVLLISCVNVANLLLARSTARRKEIAIRLALGASRRRLIRQLLTESSLLALLGGCFGMLLALWSVDLLIAVIPASRLAYMPYLRNPSLNAEVLLFTFGLSLLTGILFGLTPALDASQPDLQVAMKEGAKSSSSKTTGRLRSVLVVSEVALALILLIGAGLFIKSLIRMLSVDPGFRTENLLTMRFSLPARTYSDDVKLSAAHDDLLQRVEGLPGVKGVATVSSLPLSGEGGTGTPQIVGRPPVSGNDWGESFLRTVSPDYFNVMGVPLFKGRLFTDRDDPSTPNAVIINKTLADRVFPSEESVGQHITFMFTADQPPFEIVGVVGDEKVKSLDASTAPVIYFPFRQSPESNMSLVVRTTTDPQIMAAAVRNEVQSIDKEIPLYSVMTMEKLISNAPATFMRRYPAYLIGVFAAVALALAVVGIYGVISYSVSQRVSEMAIRVALGAQRSDILKLILKQGMLLAFLGIAVGLVGAIALTYLISNLLFGVSTADPLTYAAVSGILALVAMLACYLPARRAMKVDPIAALRYE